MSTLAPELTRIFNNIKQKNVEQKEKFSEELRIIFKNYIDVSEDVK